MSLLEHAVSRIRRRTIPFGVGETQVFSPPRLNQNLGLHTEKV